MVNENDVRIQTALTMYVRKMKTFIVSRRRKAIREQGPQHSKCAQSVWDVIREFITVVRE